MKKLLSVTAALLLLLSTQTALADHRDRGWDRDHSRYDRHDNDRGWGNSWNNRRDNRRWNNRHDHDNVSLSLSFGNVWSDYRYRDWNRATSGLGIAYTTAWGAPYDMWGYNNRRPIIVHQNTYVSEPRTRVVTRTPTSRTSLFRDINGRCFEREIDSNGNESRVEIPASECDF